jgi:hypothetical protein
MFDKVSRAAEKLATNVSRRRFLGRMGQAALSVAGAIGASLALPGLAQAGNLKKNCTYRCIHNLLGFYYISKTTGCKSNCPSEYQRCLFVGASSCY